MAKRQKPIWVELSALRWAFDVSETLSGADGQGRKLDPAIGSNIIKTLAWFSKENAADLGYDALADRCRCSRRTVANWLAAMEAQGIITKAKGDKSSSGRGRPTDTIHLMVENYSARGASNKQSEIHEYGAPGASNEPSELSAPIAELSAPIAELSAPGAPPLNNNNNTP